MLCDNENRLINEIIISTKADAAVVLFIFTDSYFTDHNALLPRYLLCLGGSEEAWGHLINKH